MSIQITFQSETLTTMTGEMFLTTVQSHMSLQTDLPSERIPSDRTHKALSTTLYHKVSHKVPSDSERLRHIAHVYILSPVCIIKLSLIALWVVKPSLHIALRWGWTLACTLEWSVKALSVWSAQRMYGTIMVSLQYVFSCHYPNSDLLWRLPTYRVHVLIPCVLLSVLT